ncbi:MAG: amidohydrolase family protein, partial [Acidiphilium sp.]|nr:amidohydrolase family protein [Acidiphilium sp.]
MTRCLWFDWAWVDERWQERVALDIDAAGMIAAVRVGVPAEEAEIVPGAAMPGLANVHSHAFQRAMAGLAERGNRPGEDFWSWRHVMYRIANELDPDEVEAVAAMAYVEMLEAGFTVAGEFHYLHHGRPGAAYADRAALAGRIV